MIVFGTGAGKPRDHGPTLPVTCPRCNNQVLYHYVSRTRWYRLYFLPLFPMSKIHILLCPICNHGPVLTRDELPRVQALNQVAEQYRRHSVSETDFRHAVDVYRQGRIPVLPGPVLDAPAQPGPVPLEPVPAAAGPPAGWYPDPDGSERLRWWDGKGWSTHVKPAT